MSISHAPEVEYVVQTNKDIKEIDSGSSPVSPSICSGIEGPKMSESQSIQD